MKLTEWYPAHIKPVHIGWYDTNVPTQRYFVESSIRWYWDGKNWRSGKRKDSKKSCSQNRMWRGIAK